MNEAWSNALTRAVTEVFESLCFMSPAPRGSMPPEPEGLSLVVLAVDFTGAGRGALQLVLPDSMVAAVASSMLGEDGALEPSEQYDAVCELANIVCGNVLPLVAGERAVFDLASPRVIATLGAGFAEHEGADAATQVLLDEGLVTASLSLSLVDAQGAA